MRAGGRYSLSLTSFSRSHLLFPSLTESLWSFWLLVDVDRVGGEEVVVAEAIGGVTMLTDVPITAGVGCDTDCVGGCDVDCCFALLALSLDRVDLLVVGPGDWDKFLSFWDDVRSDWTLLVVLLVLWGDEEFELAFFSAVWQSRQIREPFEDFCHIRLDVALHFTHVGLRCDIASIVRDRISSRHSRAQC